MSTGLTNTQNFVSRGNPLKVLVRPIFFENYVQICGLIVFSLFWDTLSIVSIILSEKPGPKNQVYVKFQLLFSHKINFRFQGVVG